MYNRAVIIDGVKSRAEGGMKVSMMVLQCQAFTKLDRAGVWASVTRQQKTPAQTYRGLVNTSQDYQKLEKILASEYDPNRKLV